MVDWYSMSARRPSNLPTPIVSMNVRSGPQPPQNNRCSVLPKEVVQQGIERTDVDVADVGEDVPRHRHAVVEGKERLLALRLGNRNDDSVEHCGRAANEVVVTVREGVKGSGIDDGQLAHDASRTSGRARPPDSNRNR